MMAFAQVRAGDLEESLELDALSETWSSVPSEDELGCYIALFGRLFCPEMALGPMANQTLKINFSF